MNYNIIKERIKSQIYIYSELEKKAMDRGNTSSIMMYINQKIGLNEAMCIVLETEAEEIKSNFNQKI